jgi:hypothetical protein
MTTSSSISTRHFGQVLTGRTAGELRTLRGGQAPLAYLLRTLRGGQAPLAYLLMLWTDEYSSIACRKGLLRGAANVRFLFGS